MTINVYITQSTFHSRISTAFLKNAKENFKDINFLNVPKKVGENLKLIFSEKDLHLFYSSYIALLASKNPNFESYVSGSYHEDLTFKTTPPKYHLNINCKWMRKSYQNVSVPPEIKNRGEKEIEKYREFSEVHKNLFHTDPDKFFIKVMAHFRLKEDLQVVEIPNTGVAMLDEETKKKLDNQLYLLIEQALIEIDKIPIIKNYKYAKFTMNKETFFPKEAVVWHKEYKQRIAALLNDKLIYENLPHFSMSSDFVEEFGILPCKSCCR